MMHICVSIMQTHFFYKQHLHTSALFADIAKVYAMSLSVLFRYEPALSFNTHCSCKYYVMVFYFKKSTNSHNEHVAYNDNIAPQLSESLLIKCRLKVSWPELSVVC